MEAFLEIIEHMVASPHGERHKRHRRCFVGATREDARVTDVEIGNVVSLSPFVRNESLGIIPETAHARFMQARTRTIVFLVFCPQLSAHRF